MKRAVILFNLGGPDSLRAVKPFLFNLFNDPAIIPLPWLPRKLLAWRISSKRAPIAREIYAKLNGKSPLLEQTEAQARALEAALGPDYRCFISMRYWHPMTAEVVEQVKQWQPDEIILLPLYPHYSCTTTGSSVECWNREVTRQKLDHIPTRMVHSYPDEPGLIAATVHQISLKLMTMHQPRILFSAHGLPQSVIDKGDPYQKQIELMVHLLVQHLELAANDWALCYQSRVGKQVWIGPPIDDELQLAAQQCREVLVVPVSFVSEHSETLVELDIEYGERAHELGIPAYDRAATVQCHPEFIAGLARLVQAA